MMYKKQIEEIKQLAATDANAVIFVSNSVLWWATSIEEVEEATKIGKRFLDVNVKLALKNNANNPKERVRIASMKLQTDRLIASKDVHLCPVGTKVVTKPLAEFLPNILEKSFAFGKHGVNAFFATHHKNIVQNGKFRTLKDWDCVNAYLDGLSASEVTQVPIQEVSSNYKWLWIILVMLAAFFIGGFVSCTKKETCYTYSVATYQKYTSTLNGVPGTWKTKDSVVCAYYEEWHTDKVVDGSITYFTVYSNRR